MMMPYLDPRACTRTNGISHLDFNIQLDQSSFYVHSSFDKCFCQLIPLCFTLWSDFRLPSNVVNEHVMMILFVVCCGRCSWSADVTESRLFRFMSCEPSPVQQWCITCDKMGEVWPLDRRVGWNSVNYHRRCQRVLSVHYWMTLVGVVPE